MNWHPGPFYGCQPRSSPPVSVALRLSDCCRPPPGDPHTGLVRRRPKSAQESRALHPAMRRRRAHQASPSLPTGPRAAGEAAARRLGPTVPGGPGDGRTARLLASPDVGGFRAEALAGGRNRLGARPGAMLALFPPLHPALPTCGFCGSGWGAAAGCATWRDETRSVPRLRIVLGGFNAAGAYRHRGRRRGGAAGRRQSGSEIRAERRARLVETWDRRKTPPPPAARKSARQRPTRQQGPPVPAQ